MAFNSTYETVYGFDVLDTFHNFFPEMMYDDMIFHNEALAWMRARVNALFPTVFTRQQNMYRIYSAQERRNQFHAFQTNQANQQSPIRVTTTIPPITIPTSTIRYERTGVTGRAAPTRVAPTVPAAPAAPAVATAAPAAATAAPAAAAAATDISGAAVPQVSTRATYAAVAASAPGGEAAPRLSANRMNAINSPMEDLLTVLLAPQYTTRQSDNQLLANMFALGGFTTARNVFDNTIWTDVPVIPTAQQIDEGSEIVELIDVPEDISCAVCQERGQVTPWRHLHCDHYFHRACVDRWFGQNVHCPVCRADIRVENVE
jgi:hypothetical protein